MFLSILWPSKHWVVDMIHQFVTFMCLASAWTSCWIMFWVLSQASKCIDSCQWPVIFLIRMLVHVFVSVTFICSNGVVGILSGQSQIHVIFAAYTRIICHATFHQANSVAVASTNGFEFFCHYQSLTHWPTWWHFHPHPCEAAEVIPSTVEIGVKSMEKRVGARRIRGCKKDPGLLRGVAVHWNMEFDYSEVVVVLFWPANCQVVVPATRAQEEGTVSWGFWPSFSSVEWQASCNGWQSRAWGSHPSRPLHLLSSHQQMVKREAHDQHSPQPSCQCLIGKGILHHHMIYSLKDDWCCHRREWWCWFIFELVEVSM